MYARDAKRAVTAVVVVIISVDIMYIVRNVFFLSSFRSRNSVLSRRNTKNAYYLIADFARMYEKPNVRPRGDIARIVYLI